MAPSNGAPEGTFGPDALTVTVDWDRCSGARTISMEDAQTRLRGSASSLQYSLLHPPAPHPPACASSADHRLPNSFTLSSRCCMYDTVLTKISSLTPSPSPPSCPPRVSFFVPYSPSSSSSSSSPVTCSSAWPNCRGRVVSVWPAHRFILCPPSFPR